MKLWKLPEVLSTSDLYLGAHLIIPELLAEHDQHVLVFNHSFIWPIEWNSQFQRVGDVTDLRHGSVLLGVRIICAQLVELTIACVPGTTLCGYLGTWICGSLGCQNARIDVQVFVCRRFFWSYPWRSAAVDTNNIQKAIEYGPVEIVDLPMKNCDFP